MKEFFQDVTAPLDVDTTIRTSGVQLETLTTGFQNGFDRLSGDALITVASNIVNTMPGAQTMAEGAISEMQKAVDGVGSLNASLKLAVDQLSATAADYSTTVVSTKDSVDKMKQELERERQIQEARREQVAALKGREDSNYHSSWMGLTRPLRTESQTGLLVAAVAFLIVGLFAVWMTFKEDFPVLFQEIMMRVQSFPGLRGGGGRRKTSS
jgi:hypothetical protein